MVIDKGLSEQIFRVTPADFHATALEVFRFQHQHNPLYKRFCELQGKNPENVSSIHTIPFLPISFFKTAEIRTSEFEAAVVFESSGTSGEIPSRHFVKDLSIYETSFQKGFGLAYGDPSDYSFLGLLPNYLERQHSSLVHMVDNLIKKSEHEGGFFLYDHDKLAGELRKNIDHKIPTVLIGVTYALLDFAESNPMNLGDVIIMETGGMKGRREELTREEVHEALKQQFGVNAVHSEYGMTELLSQAYSKSDGLFNCPPWMKVLSRAVDDPNEVSDASNGKITGAANIIDLANLYSCSFIATDDQCTLHPRGLFEIIGRLDNCDIRGCGLMIA